MTLGKELIANFDRLRGLGDCSRAISEREV
jgi:hypothetical protein